PLAVRDLITGLPDATSIHIGNDCVWKHYVAFVGIPIVDLTQRNEIEGGFHQRYILDQFLCDAHVDPDSERSAGMNSTRAIVTFGHRLVIVDAAPIVLRRAEMNDFPVFSDCVQK